MLCFPNFLTVSYRFLWCLQIFPPVFLQFQWVFFLFISVFLPRVFLPVSHFRYYVDSEDLRTQNRYWLLDRSVSTRINFTLRRWDLAICWLRENQIGDQNIITFVLGIVLLMLDVACSNDFQKTSFWLLHKYHSRSLFSFPQQQ